VNLFGQIRTEGKVVIRDLKPTVARMLIRNDASLNVVIEDDTYNDGGMYYTMRLEIVVPHCDEDDLLSKLGNLLNFDSSVFGMNTYPDRIYFESDGADGAELISFWVDAMRDKFPALTIKCHHHYVSREKRVNAKLYEPLRKKK
jgi:hypothetical protein